MDAAQEPKSPKILGPTDVCVFLAYGSGFRLHGFRGRQAGRVEPGISIVLYRHEIVEQQPERHSQAGPPHPGSRKGSLSARNLQLERDSLMASLRKSMPVPIVFAVGGSLRFRTL